MKAARLHAYDPAVGPESLTVEEVGEPRVEGAFDVIVRVGGAGLCRTDIHVIEGQWRHIHDPNGSLLPSIPGHENAGWVEEIGSAVTNVEVGDAVAVHPQITCGLCLACRAGHDMQCDNATFSGQNVPGGFAELLKTSARSVLKLAPGLRPADIAALTDAGLTAYHAVKKALPLLYPGSRVVVLGAGGLGHIGIQCLKALTSAEIIVVDPSEEALSLAKGWGADQTVLADGQQVNAVLERTEGRGGEIVMDFVGEKGAESAAWKMTRPAGSHFVVGYGGTIEIPTIDIISTERSIVGNLVGTYNDLVELMTLTSQGKVSLHTKTYPLSAINDAVQDLNSGNLKGRGIIVPEPS